MTDKLTKANLKRTTAFKRLQETYECGLKVSNDESLKPEFLARANAIDGTYNEFQSNHNTVISLINDDEFSSYDEMRLNADKAFYGVLSLKHDFLLNDSSSQAANMSTVDNSNFSNRRSVVNLPKLSLMRFEGSYKDFPTYFDVFNSLIHNNPDISNVEKFQYLLTSLGNEPLALIKGIPLTEGNYTVAYEKLEKRYKNTRILASHYYNEIFNAPSISKANSFELRKLLSVLSENVAALRVMKLPVDHWDFLLFNMLLNKLDSKTRTNFELEHSLSQELPTYRQLMSFLDRQCIALESVQYIASSSHKPKVNNEKHVSSFLVESSPNSVEQSKCILCSSPHALYKCGIFLSKSPQERFSIAKQHKLCVNCLVSPHSMRNCVSSHKCRVCKFPHHTTLHFDKKSNDTASEQNSNVQVTSSNPSVGPSVGCNPSTSSSITNTLVNTYINSDCITSTLSLPQSTILLSTCEAEVNDIRGNFTTIRILLDTGSMANFISESCVQRLGLSKRNFSIPVEGLNGISLAANSGIVQCTMKPCGQIDPTFSFEAIVLPKVCSNQPKFLINPSELTHLQTLKLADPKFHIPGPIDIIPGNELTDQQAKTATAVTALTTHVQICTDLKREVYRFTRIL
ncbi:uncharacterized protein LOC126880865 [Diabrotica virgifera virgifera]|uniref:Peptidase aspartic putative domain-containing protein n=1 Tax=Diabrotica virgifera virgifera TaxID=50390 RepID=A0ABM5JSH3_DIAVI|nr:uncharacterized protein LOC126880865 [Diabrotica virgifera virgifera]